VLVEVWDNPPGQQSLGMILPADSTPFDADSWAVVIQYQEDGYVSDDDAATIDYDALLQEMQEATRADSAERIDQGYAGIELVGWAAAPYYNAETNKRDSWRKEGSSSAMRRAAIWRWNPMTMMPWHNCRGIRSPIVLP
jgi:uncharacterized membrane-anchored protein